MNKLIPTLIAGAIALFLSCPFVLAHSAGFNVPMNNGHGKIVDDGDSIIHSDAGGKARITADGRLSINGKTVTSWAMPNSRIVSRLVTGRHLAACS